MMGSANDPGKVMGALFENAPGPRVKPAEADHLGDAVRAGAAVDRSNNRIIFTAAEVRLTALASPTTGPDETFRIAGMVNPTIVVPKGAQVVFEIINADNDTAHGLVVTAEKPKFSWMPMMSSRPAFVGSAIWFLGDPTAAGMQVGTLNFVADTSGRFYYLCPVSGHAAKGMFGSFIVAR
jgi:rusticyanin